MSEATSSGTGSLPASQSRTSLGHTPSFWARRTCPQAMRRNSRLSCAGVNVSSVALRSTHPVSPLGRRPRIDRDAARGINLPDRWSRLPRWWVVPYRNPALRTRKKGGLFARPPFLSRSVGLETDRSYERPHRPVDSSCLRRSCERSSSTPRRPQPSVFPQPPSPGSSAPAGKCRGYSCPRPLSDPTD